MIEIKLKRPCHSVDITIKTNSDKFAEQIKLFYNSFTDDNFDNKNDIVSISVIFKNNIAYFNDKTTDNPMQEVVNFIYDNIKINDNFFAMHAAAVAYKDNAYAFAAATSTGKTTLTGYLINSGFDYITDDCVLINKNTLEVTPFCNTVHLREGGVKILKKYSVEPQNLIKISEGTVERFLYIPENQIEKEIPLKHIFFIERNENVNIINTLPSSDIIARLIKSAISPYTLSSDYLKFFIKLSRFSKTFINYKDMDFVADYIKTEHK